MKNAMKGIVSIILVAFIFIGPYSLRQGVYYYRKTAEVNKELQEALQKKSSLENQIKDKINADISSRGESIVPTDITDVDNYIRSTPNSSVASLTVLSINKGEVNLLNTVMSVGESPDADGFEYKLSVDNVNEAVQYIGQARLYIESLRASYTEKTVTVRVNLRGY